MLVLTVKKMDDRMILTQQFLGQVIQQGDKLFKNLATAEEEDFTHDIIKEEARAIFRRTIDDEDNVRIQSENGDAEEVEGNPDEDIPVVGQLAEEEEDSPDVDDPLDNLDEGVLITGDEEVLHINDDIPADKDDAMEHADDDTNDDVFTSAKTSTDKSSSLNTKVAAVEKEQDRESSSLNAKVAAVEEEQDMGE
jgi:hypothetical protein